jgi:hypothetical protein
MKTVSPQLQALLLTKVFVLCDLYTFTLTSGLVLRYCTADYDVRDTNGNTFSSAGPYFDKVSTHKGFHAKTGLDTDTWEVTVAPRLADPVTGAQFPDLIGDVPWLQAVVVGVLDGAVAQVDRAYFPAWPGPPWGLNNPFPPTATGVLYKLFYGRVGPISYTRTSATITLNSWLNLLSTTQMPAQLYGNTCRHTLFDAGCTLTAATYARSGVIASSPGYNSQTLVLGGNPTLPGGLVFALGRITMTSGTNSGLQKRVLGYTPATSTVVLDYPFPFPVNAGDGYTIYAGCDKQMSTCTNFGNLVNYGGFPYIPVPELAF